MLGGQGLHDQPLLSEGAWPCSQPRITVTAEGPFTNRPRAMQLDSSWNAIPPLAAMSRLSKAVYPTLGWWGGGIREPPSGV